MPDGQVLDASALVRPGRAASSKEAAPRNGRAAGLPPRVAGMMTAVSLATFVTLTGGYRLLFVA